MYYRATTIAKPFRSYVPEQDLLLPPSLRDWLPDGHMAFFVSDLVDHLDLSASPPCMKGRIVGSRHTTRP